jgi:hypothetical protein
MSPLTEALSASRKVENLPTIGREEARCAPLAPRARPATVALGKKGYTCRVSAPHPSLLHRRQTLTLCARRSSGVTSMSKASKNFRRERVRSKRVKFWQMLGRITWKLVVLARVLTRLVEIGYAIIRWLRD